MQTSASTPQTDSLRAVYQSLKQNIMLLTCIRRPSFCFDFLSAIDLWERCKCNKLLWISKLSVFTLWYLWKVLRDKQPRPIWEKTVNTSEADPPASKIARQRRKLPAGNFVPGINGWLCHVFFGLVHLELEQLLVTSACFPAWWTSTIGLSALQMWQNPNNSSKWERNAICFGSRSCNKN